jgi:SAM-dependent methyltransferase
VARARTLGWLGQGTEPAEAARLAALYEVDTAEKDDDIPFFREMAKRTGGPILELGCGTGRVAIPLARDGHRVVGLDRSAAQLAIARRKAGAAGVKLELVAADMRAFALPEPFRLIVVAFNTFLLLTPDERRACLARVREHLAREGTFLLDVFQPNPEVIAGKQGALVHEWTRVDPETGRTVMKSQWSEADVDGVDTAQLYDEIDQDGVLRRYARSFRLHYLYRRELELLLAGAGFAVEAVYGSYDLEPVTSRSPKLLAVARRRERSVIDRRRAE